MWLQSKSWHTGPCMNACKWTCARTHTQFMADLAEIQFWAQVQTLSLCGAFLAIIWLWWVVLIFFTILYFTMTWYILLQSLVSSVKLSTCAALFWSWQNHYVKWKCCHSHHHLCFLEVSIEIGRVGISPLWGFPDNPGLSRGSGRVSGARDGAELGPAITLTDPTQQLALKGWTIQDKTLYYWD